MCLCVSQVVSKVFRNSRKLERFSPAQGGQLRQINFKNIHQQCKLLCRESLEVVTLYVYYCNAKCLLDVGNEREKRRVSSGAMLAG